MNIIETTKEQKCEYKIHTPADEGYPDIKGNFYECDCGASYIEIEQAQEWILWKIYIII